MSDGRVKVRLRCNTGRLETSLYMDSGMAEELSDRFAEIAKDVRQWE